jgi:hypothetical protein
MKTMKSLVALALLLGLVQLQAGEAPPPSQSDMEAQMAELKKQEAPNDHHQHMQKLAGTWKAEATFWLAPGAPPTKSLATMKSEVILDGRFLKSEYNGDFMGTPFRGMAIEGYDNKERKHTSMWMDNMTTKIMASSGTCEQGGMVVTLHAEGPDPMTGKHKKVKMVTTMQAPDRYVMESWETEEGGQPRKTMEIKFTKQG